MCWQFSAIDAAYMVFHANYSGLTAVSEVINFKLEIFYLFKQKKINK